MDRKDMTTSHGLVTQYSKEMDFGNFENCLRTTIMTPSANAAATLRVAIFVSPPCKLATTGLSYGGGGGCY